jgi:Ca2+-binding EF-hand superfamily protein
VRDIRALLLSKGLFGIRNLSNLYRKMDPKNSGKLELNDARWGLFHFGYQLSKEEAQMLINLCDKLKTGWIDYKEFLNYLRVLQLYRGLSQSKGKI